MEGSCVLYNDGALEWLGDTRLLEEVWSVPSALTTARPPRADRLTRRIAKHHARSDPHDHRYATCAGNRSLKIGESEDLAVRRRVSFLFPRFLVCDFEFHGEVFLLNIVALDMLVES